MKEVLYTVKISFDAHQECYIASVNSRGLSGYGETPGEALRDLSEYLDMQIAESEEEEEY